MGGWAVLAAASIPEACSCAHRLDVATPRVCPMAERTHTEDTRLAQELGTWADTQPGGEAIHDDKLL